MAIIYCWSGAGGSGTGADWTNAFTTLAAALAAWTSADVIYLASDSSESYSAHTSYSVATTAAAPIPIFSVDRTDDSYKPATSVQVTTTPGYYIYLRFHTLMFGVYFKTGNNLYMEPAAGIGRGKNLYTDCTFEMYRGGYAQDRFLPGGASNLAIQIDYVNCSFINSGAGSSYWQNYAANVTFYGCTFDYTTDSSGGFQNYGNSNGYRFYGCDLSNVTFSSVPIFYAVDAYPIINEMFNCLIPSGVSLLTGTHMATEAYLYNTDDAGNLDRVQGADGLGNAFLTTTSVYRDSGYSGVDNQVSYKISVASAVKQYRPYDPNILICGYVSTTGSKTFTVEIAHDYTSSLKDVDIAFELFYLGTASETNHSLKSSAPAPTGAVAAPLAAGSTLTTSSETWTGGSGLTKQKASITATVNKAGVYALRPRIMKYEASKFIYLDPKVTVA